MRNSSFRLELKSAGKKFFRNWIFKDLSYSIQSSSKVAILGKNGSGKSTLLQVIAGYESLSSGSITYYSSEKKILRENIFRHVSLAAPYLELTEEFTLEELVHFHFSFKQPQQNLTAAEIISLMQLESSKGKVFKYFSSGMKQRTKLALAMISDTDLILLDEPLSNLDKDGEKWYGDMVSRFLTERSVVICSNHTEAEYHFCNLQVDIGDYK